MEKSTRDAYGEVLAELGKTTPNLIVLDTDLSKSTRTQKFSKEFPDRYFNIGIAEQNMIGIAAGLASTGKLVFVSGYAIFVVARALEQIRNSVALNKLNVKIVVSHGGLTVGEDGSTHQSVEDISLMRSIPNMRICIPADAIETHKMIKRLSELNEPCYVRLSRAETPLVFDENYDFNYKKAHTLRYGNDLTIIATGTMVAKSLQAADVLRQVGIEARLINMHTLKPIDEVTIKDVARDTGAIVTVEEHSILGGLGTAVSEVLIRNHAVPLEMVGITDEFGRSGSYKDLLEKYGLTVSEIIKACEKVLGRKNANLD